MGITIIIILFIVALLVVSLWMHRKVKTKPVKIIIRTIVAIIVAIPFFILSIVVLVAGFWGGDRLYERPYYSHFNVINESSTPLWVSANLAYTPVEVKSIWEQDADFYLESNFVTFQNVFVNNTEHREEYAFEVPCHWHGAGVPSELDIVFKDSQGTTLLRLDCNDIDSVVRANMRIVITDSLIQALNLKKLRVEEEIRRETTPIGGHQEGGVE